MSRRRERVKLLQKIQHGLPAFVLFFQGFDRMWQGGADGSEASRWLGTFEAGTAFLVIGAIAREIARLREGSELPQRRRTHDQQVDYLDIMLSMMLAVEVVAHWFETGHIKRPTVMLSLVMLAIGLLHGRIKVWGVKRRSLRIDDHGIRVGRVFGAFSASWQEIERIDVTDKTATIVARGGRTHTFDLRDIRHSADLTRALTKAGSRREAALASAGAAEPQPS